MSAPFAAGSVSLGLHAIEPRNGPGQAQAIVEQALAAEQAGFAGVTLSEHHGAFPGYMGQPLLAANWILAATDSVWAGPAPYLLSLRNPMLVAEELAWTAARFPGRVAAALAPGYAKADYDLLDLDFEDRAQRFEHALCTVLQTLSAGAVGVEADPAVTAWRARPGVLLTAGNSRPGVRRAARSGTGLLLPGGGMRERYRELVGCYRDSGGVGPVVKIRQIWMGTPPPGSLEARDAVYKQAASKDMRQAQGFAEPFLHGDDGQVLAELSRDIDEFGLDAINIRFHLAGVTHEQVLEQIACFGARILPRLRVSQPA